MRVREGLLACSVAFVALIGVMLPWSVSRAAQPSNWTLMPPPGRNYRKPDDAYRIFVPSNFPTAQLQQLSLELDGVDVTAMVTREGSYAVFKPPQALSFGKHKLRLVQYASDGSINELGLWTFDVRKSALFREASAQANVDLIGSYRASDHNLGDLGGRGSLSGSAQASAQVANADWRATGDLQLVVDTQQHHAVDMSSFLLTGQTQQATVNVGRHTIDAGSLVLGSLNRRGVSGTYASRDQHYSATAFAMRTNDVLGFRDGLGVGSPDNRITGLLAKAYPISDAPGRLFLQGVYLQGKGAPDDSTNVYGATPTTGGDAWSLAADSNFLQQRLRLRAEYAATRYDFDGLNTGYPKESAHAQTYLIQYTPWLDKVVDQQPMQWSYGASRTVVGQFFNSIANPGGLPPGQQSTKVFTTFNWAAWSLSGSFGRQFDNADDDPSIPTTRTDLFNLIAGYAPQPAPNAKPPTGLARVFAQPSYTLTLQRNRQNFSRTPLGYSGDIVDNTMRSAELAATFTPGAWNWGLSHTYTQIDDASGMQDSSRDNLTDANSTFQIGEGNSGSLDVSWDINRDRVTQVDTKTLMGSLGLTLALLPDRLSASAQYSLNRTYASDDSVDTTSGTTTVTLTWTLRKGRDNGSDTTLSLSGTYADTTDHVTPSAVTNNYEVFVNINVPWRGTY